MRLFVMSALGLMLAVSASATAQTSTTMDKMFPNTPGVARGMSSVNNSGQTGTATIHKVSDTKTDVVVALKSHDSGRAQGAAIFRDPAGDCNSPPKETYEFTLNPIVNGSSHTQIPIGIDRLLSGNYFVVSYSKDQPSHVFSCGRLFNR